ncbi:HERC1, partial [Symbiodinium sp. CCMP2456]
GAEEDWEPQIRWRDERYEAMLKEHEQVKQILQQEMLKAQEACKQIEEQVRRFPNPFEAELEELKDRYAQMQAGTQRLSVENVQLREKLQDQEEAFQDSKKGLEDQLRVAHDILEQVSTLGALRHLSQEAATAVKKLKKGWT